MSTPAATVRASAVDRIADAHVQDSAALDPLFATAIGVPGYERSMPDLSPDGHTARAALARATLSRLDAVPDADQDDTDRVSVAAMRERLGLQLEVDDAGENLRSLNVLDSPVQALREVFDLMPTETEADWADIAARLAALPDALAGYRESLLRARSAGHVAARRQVERVAEQCVDLGGPTGFFAALPARMGAPERGSLASTLHRAATDAAAAYTGLAASLRAELLPVASGADAVGRERYELASRYFLGARVDLVETYEWGLAELARIEAEMARVADQLVPGGGLDDAIAALDADPARTIRGRAAFINWAQQLADRSVAELGAGHFDIPAPVRTLQCRLAPTTTGGMYYTPPTADFSRPGAMWWSLPANVQDFSTWREVTVIYHEGVPGHHLQCGQTVYRSAELNSWRRMACWVSGHGEGWALYAERLMGELGYLADPGARMGMLDAQALRAVRVALDIGVHLRLPAPTELGGGTWDADKAWTFLTSHTRMDKELAAFELNRYLGWPGQAPSYKVGERIWLELREAVRAREGDAFDLAAFHRRALDLGSLGLDVLRSALLATG